MAAKKTDNASTAVPVWAADLAAGDAERIIALVASAQGHINASDNERMAAGRDLLAAEDLLSGDTARLFAAASAAGLSLSRSALYDLVNAARFDRASETVEEIRSIVDSADVPSIRAKGALGSFAKEYGAAKTKTAKKKILSSLKQTVAAAKKKSTGGTLTYEGITAARGEILGTAPNSDDAQTKRVNAYAGKMRDELNPLIIESQGMTQVYREEFGSKGPVLAVLWLMSETLKKWGAWGPEAGAAIALLMDERIRELREPNPPVNEPVNEEPVNENENESK